MKLKVVSVYFFYLTTLFSHSINPSENNYQAQTVIEQIRSGSLEKPCNDQHQYKVTNSADNLAKREYLKEMLVKHFPDLESRLSLEKRQVISS